MCKRLSLELKTHRLKVKGWKELFHGNENNKRAGSNTNILQIRL